MIVFGKVQRYKPLPATKRRPGRLTDSLIGQLPRKLSRATRFFLSRGGVGYAKFTGIRITEDLHWCRGDQKFQLKS